MATIAQNLETLSEGIADIKENLGLSEDASLSDIVTKSATDSQEYADCLSISNSILAGGVSPVSGAYVYYEGTNLNDKSGNNKNGTLTGSYSTSQKGIIFSGGYGTTGNISSARGTWEMYCKVNSNFSPRNSQNWFECSCIMGCELAQQQQDFGIVIDSSGYVAIGYGMTDISSTTTKINDGNFHHLVITTSNSDLKLYVDGELAKTVTFQMTGSIPTNYGIFWNKSSNTTSVAGEVQLFRYYTTALTSSEVLKNYRAVTASES